MKWALFSLVLFFVLKSTLSNINITTAAFKNLILASYNVFYPFIFNLFVSLYYTESGFLVDNTWFSCFFVFFFYPDNFCLFMGDIFLLFPFNMIVDMVKYKPTILLFVFLSPMCPLFSFFLCFWFPVDWVFLLFTLSPLFTVTCNSFFVVLVFLWLL